MIVESSLKGSLKAGWQETLRAIDQVPFYSIKEFPRSYNGSLWLQEGMLTGSTQMLTHQMHAMKDHAYSQIVHHDVKSYQLPFAHTNFGAATTDFWNRLSNLTDYFGKGFDHPDYIKEYTQYVRWVHAITDKGLEEQIARFTGHPDTDIVEQLKLLQNVNLRRGLTRSGEILQQDIPLGIIESIEAAKKQEKPSLQGVVTRRSTRYPRHILPQPYPYNEGTQTYDLMHAYINNPSTIL